MGLVSTLNSVPQAARHSPQKPSNKPHDLNNYGIRGYICINKQYYENEMKKWKGHKMTLKKRMG